MLLKNKDTLVFIGDSITDCERARPDGEGLFGALGRGFVSYVDAMLRSAYPELTIRVINTGVSGDTVLDLKSRWQQDALDRKPDVLSIMIGINDVWRQFDLPQIKEKHVYPDEYRATLMELVEQTKPHVRHIMLMTPFYIEPLQTDAMRKRMDEYGAIVRSVASESGTLFVDTQKAFGPVLEHIHSASVAWDRVHPNATGHMVLAGSFLRAIGFDFGRL